MIEGSGSRRSKNIRFRNTAFLLPLLSYDICKYCRYLTRYYSLYLNWQEEHPEDYRLVMRKDVVEKELADEDQNR
jgi:hypothetical protein